MGHALFLEQASKLGKLVVGINTDDYVTQYKGKKPIFSFDERKELIDLLDCVYFTIPNDQDSLEPLLRKIKPRFLVIGSDWGDKYFEQIKMSPLELKQVGTQMVYLPYTKNISSSEIKRRLV